MGGTRALRDDFLREVVDLGLCLVPMTIEHTRMPRVILKLLFFMFVSTFEKASQEQGSSCCLSWDLA